MPFLGFQKHIKVLMEFLDHAHFLQNITPEKEAEWRKIFTIQNREGHQMKKKYLITI